MNLKSILWLAFSLSLIVLGIVCIANPNDTMIVLAYLVGFIMLFSGLGSLVYFFQTRFMMILIDGLLSCVFGLVLLFGGEEIAQSFIPLLIALWLILKGILWLIHAWRISKISNLASGVMIMGGLYVLLGILFVVFPEVLATLISLILGITLIISGSIGLFFGTL
ncbi:HdeD family acid-resistance protein [Helicobacter labetoulli]|uniref:HdeD family acid-resistance protein n=1 Tax=Helicobacter labetoulli TaxID=2315333 RepID=UPI001FC9EDF3|nr:DUF308 domain-containing protein [Helicobacter labetoulli]